MAPPLRSRIAPAGVQAGARRPGQGQRMTIGQSIAAQQSRLLRQGQAGNQRYSQVRQRHIWNTFYFTSGYPNSQIATGTGGLVLAAGEYQFFSSLSNANGQGLPQGFILTDLDTNFPSAGRVSDDQNFAIWEIGITLEPMRPDVVAGATAAMNGGAIHPLDLDQITQNAFLSIKYLTNEVPLGLLKDFPQSGGPSMVAPSLLDYSARGGTEVAGAGPAGVTGGLQEGAVLAGAQVSPWSSRHARTAHNSGPLSPAPGWRRPLQVPIFLQNTAVFFFKVVFSRNVQLLSVQQGGTGGFRMRLDWWAVESFREQG